MGISKYTSIFEKLGVSNDVMMTENNFNLYTQTVPTSAYTTNSAISENVNNQRNRLDVAECEPRSNQGGGSKCYIIVYSSFSYGAAELSNFASVIDGCAFFDFTEIERELGLQMLQNDISELELVGRRDSEIQKMFTIISRSSKNIWVLMIATPKLPIPDICEKYIVESDSDHLLAISSWNPVNRWKLDKFLDSKFVLVEPEYIDFSMWCYVQLIPGEVRDIAATESSSCRYAKKFGYKKIRFQQLMNKIAAPGVIDRDSDMFNAYGYTKFRTRRKRTIAQVFNSDAPDSATISDISVSASSSRTISPVTVQTPIPSSSSAFSTVEEIGAELDAETDMSEIDIESLPILLGAEFEYF